jgi:hypothetical protein
MFIFKAFQRPVRGMLGARPETKMEYVDPFLDHLSAADYKL